MNWYCMYPKNMYVFFLNKTNNFKSLIPDSNLIETNFFNLFFSRWWSIPKMPPRLTPRKLCLAFIIIFFFTTLFVSRSNKSFLLTKRDVRNEVAERRENAPEQGKARIYYIKNKLRMSRKSHLNRKLCLIIYYHTFEFIQIFLVF